MGNGKNVYIRHTPRTEPSAGPGAFFANSNQRRLLIAFAIAVALHEIAAALIPAAAPRGAPQQVVLAQVTIERRTPSPTPAPPALVSRVRTTPGRQAPREIVHRPGAARPKPPTFSNAKPIWDIPVGARGAGAGRASGGGSPGNDGTGSGAGNAGSGSGAAAAMQPCGYVEFSDPHGTRYDPNTGGYWVDIAMTVRFPDGHTESLMLDYPWFYRDAASNPWSERNLDNPDFATRFQNPPPEKRGGEPSLVRYVIAHSTQDGLTRLRNCPAG